MELNKYLQLESVESDQIVFSTFERNSQPRKVLAEVDQNRQTQKTIPRLGETRRSYLKSAQDGDIKPSDLEKCELEALFKVVSQDLREARNVISQLTSEGRKKDKVTENMGKKVKKLKGKIS